MMDNLSQELQPIRLQLIEVSPVDLSSVDCVEKLQSVLSECQQALQTNHDEENVLQLLKYGLEKLLLESLQAFCDQSDSVDESNESLFDIVLETVNVLAECGVKACELIVPNICVELLDMLTYKVFTFQQKMEILKSVNVLLEYSTFLVKEKLLLKQSFLETLKKLFKQILYIGDYEFQVGALECLFRLIPRKVRTMLGQKIIDDPRQLATFLIIQDSNFETDCRTFLNNLNSSLGDRKRVMSIPCISVQLGSRPLQKPSDNGYTEFWVDFNYGSQRITIFCEQDSSMLTSQATQEEDLWETISIQSSDVESFHFTESNRCVTGVFNLTANVTDIFSQMKNIEGNQLIIVSDQAYNMPQAVKKTFTQQSVKKVSSVCEPITVKTGDLNNTDMRDIEMVPSSQMSVASSVVSGTPRRVKVSVPFIPMSTPASTVSVNEKFGSRKQNEKLQPRLEKVKASVALAEIRCGSSSKQKEGFPAPSTPVINKPETKRRVKTPVVVLEPDKRFSHSRLSFDELDNNKENKDPRALEEDIVIPDSLPSQSLHKVDKKHSSHKLREADSGICLVEPDQQKHQQPDLDHTIVNKKCSTAILNTQNSHRGRKPFLTVAEASKICMESDENISDLSSEIIPIHDEIMENNVSEQPKTGSKMMPEPQKKKAPLISKKNSRVLPQKQTSSKQRNKPKPSMPVDSKRNLPERPPPPILESDDNSQPTDNKYGKGKGKGHSLYSFDKPLCATPVTEKPLLRYSLVSSRSREKIESIANVLGIEKKRVDPRLHRDIASQKTSTPVIENLKSQNIPGGSLSAGNIFSLENGIKSTTAKKHDEIIPNIPEKSQKVICKSISLPNQTVSKEIEEPTRTKVKKSRKKGDKSGIIQETSTRTLRRRKQDENKTIEETITMVQNTEDFTGAYSSPKKIQGNNSFSHSATLSSSKKAFFFESRTTVTNSYRNSTINESVDKPKTKSSSDDPYSFDDFDDDADKPISVKPSAPNKIFKSRNKGNNVVVRKSESCVNSKKSKTLSKPPLKQNKKHQPTYSGFSDDDDVSIATDRSKLSVTGSRSMPNLSKVPPEHKSIHPPRQAKSVKSYYVPSEDEIEPEEEAVTVEEPKKTKVKSTQAWKQATLDKIKDKIRDSDQFTIFNRDSWSAGKSTEKTPKFDLNVSKYPLETPHTDTERVKEKEINTNKSDSVLEKFTAICTGLLLDPEDKQEEINCKQRNRRSKSLDSVKGSKSRGLENSTGKEAQSEISWLEKKSSGKRKKFKKTYQVERERRRNKRYENEESESSSEGDVESSEEDEAKSVTSSRLVHTENKTPKLPPSSSTTPRGITHSYRKQRSPLDIQLGLTPKTPRTPADSTGLPSLCIVSEDAATAPNSVQQRKLLQDKNKLESEESIEEISVPLTVSASQNISEPTFSQITSLNELLKMATPKHIKKILEGEDENSEEGNIVEKPDKKSKKSPKSKSVESIVESLTATTLLNEDPEDADESTEEQAGYQAGLVSGPSSRARPSKSTLKRKFPDVVVSSIDEDREGTSDERSNDEHNDSSFIPRKLFKSAQKEKEQQKLSVKSSSRSNALNSRRLDNRKQIVRSSSEVRSISTEGTDASLENDLTNLEEEEVSLKTGVTAVVRTFGVDIQNQLKAKRKQLEAITQEAVKNSQKMATKMWSKQHSRRSSVLDKYQEKLLKELDILEKEIIMLKEEEDKTLNFFTHQMKLLKNYRDSQQKRVQNLSHCQDELIEELNKADEDTHHYQQNFKTTLKKDMCNLQQRLLKETQQSQLMNVRKCLQTLYLS